MPTDKPTRNLLQRIYNALAPDKPLEPGSTFYEPLYDRLHLEDPVAKIDGEIDLGGMESLRLFSGFSGSGKSTELLRLKALLEQSGRGFTILYANALDYLNPNEPIDIRELLMVLAGAFGEALEKAIGSARVHETIWDRLWTFLQTEIRLTEVSTKLEMKTPLDIFGGIKAGADLKFELKSATNFRQELTKALGNRLKELKSQVDAFFSEGVARIRERHGSDQRVVFILDSLEQFNGDWENEQDVVRSVQRIFKSELDLLRFPEIHVIFTAPPSLQFVFSGIINQVSVTLLPVMHLWENDADRSRCDNTWKMFRSLISRRLDEDGLSLLFGPPETRDALLDPVIAMSGGHLRDLLRLLRDIVRQALSRPSLPVTEMEVTRAINSLKQQFTMMITEKDAVWLDKIGRLREHCLQDEAQVGRLAQFIDSHAVLNFIDAEHWYDTHPLIRDKVAAVMKANPAPPAA